MHNRTLLSGRSTARSGFSLVELVITMTIMSILVGVVSMRANGVTNKARAAKIISVVEGLRTPVMLYMDDTNQLPLEYSGYTGANFHRLSQDPGINGWQGPYIESPISRSWNPTGNLVHMYATANYANNNGYDMDGDGTTDVIGNEGCGIIFWGIDQEIAERVDRAFDDQLPGNWMDAGRVEYNAGARRMSILLASR